MIYTAFVISINKNSNFTYPCIKNYKRTWIIPFQKEGSTLKIGLLLGIEAHLVVDSDDFRELSLLITSYVHFQTEGLDETVQLIYQFILRYLANLLLWSWFLLSSNFLGQAHFLTARQIIVFKGWILLL